MQTSSIRRPRSFGTLPTVIARTLFVLSIGANVADANQALDPDLADTIGCPIPFKNSFYSSLYKQVETNQSLMSLADFREQLQNLNRTRLVEDPSVFADTAAELFALLRQETLQRPTVDAKLEFLAGTEIGDRTTGEAARLQDRIQILWQKIDRSFGNSTDCPGDQPVATSFSSRPGTFLAMVEAKKHPIVSGGIKALGVAYQSCEAMTRASLGPNDPDVRGITITGDYPNSPGRKREISNLSELIDSHPYLSNYRRPSSSCFNVLKRPMIYDFGGKPSTSKGYLDFFTNKGGTGVLGIDCSGYVFSALASSGLRLAKNVSIKPAQVHLKNAALYMNPKANGLSCFAPVSFKGTDTIRPGDILASGGHIMIIDTVGSDPFGIAGMTREADCELSKMTSDRFQMTYLQSGSAKGGLGISRIRPQKFLPDDEAPMDDGMRDYAVAACRAKLGNKTVTVRPSRAVLVRHLGTPECSDKRVRLAYEDCISECR